MLPYRDSRLTQIAIGVFFLIVLCYGYFELQGILFGPRIAVTDAPVEVHEPFVTIQGSAERIASLRMNGTEIEVTEDGAFSEPYLLSRGQNRIVFDAKDKYGRTSQSVVTIIYTPSADSEESAASSTPATSSASEASSTPPLSATSTEHVAP
jgi:hypothetical protein